MNTNINELVMVINDAINAGRSPMESALDYWEKMQSSRDGLQEELIKLVDQGDLICEVCANSKGVRRVLDIYTVVTTSNLQVLIPFDQIDKERKVFVIHGRDTALRKSMFDFLRAINLHPLEWSELILSCSTGTPYIGEVLDQAFEQAQAVVVMLTPDEDVQLTKRVGGGEVGQQARPNVIFEAGLAIGRCPERTIIVEVGRLRPFSDIAGRHVVHLDDSADNAFARRQDLAHRLERAGCRISLRGSDWHALAGAFTLP
jgi:predicted nucleotide-binding protein